MDNKKKPILPKEPPIETVQIGLDKAVNSEKREKKK